MPTSAEIHEAANYDEKSIASYSLPNPLRRADGTPVKNAFEWVNFRRPEILAEFKRVMYGDVPPRPDAVSFEILSERGDALDGQAVRREIRLTFAMNNGRSHTVDVLVYTPKQVKSAPVFIGLNFGGNHTTTTEPDVAPTGMRGGDAAHAMPAGAQIRRWIFPEVIARGYASITASYHDFFPDREDGWPSSALSLFFTPSEMAAARPRFSAIGVWAWGLSRLLDLAECLPGIDAGRAAVHGHSRLGKTALWCGALDRRFRLICSNDSGCGGAAISRRNFGESLQSMITASPFSHWFVTELGKYAADPATLPVDQHELIALAAPRPVVVHSATLDQWADPTGEYLSCYHAGEVYRLFGGCGLATATPPPPDTPLSGDVSYLLRTGPHDQVAADWAHYLDLADRWL
ncbi:MAG: hypothetical protein PHI35_05070 [Victivallaceae bacterium]|nr:hypothetical protein [Victivallaceae bacterium]